MSLLALLSLGETGPESSPSGLLPVAGRSLLERQVRLVRRVGAERTLVVAPALPALLRERLQAMPGVTIVEAAAAAAALIGDDDRVLLLADGVELDERIVNATLADGAACRLAVWQVPPGPDAERLDAETLWSGVAVLPAPLVRDVLRGLGEWELGSTLVRTAVEHGAARLLLDSLEDYAPARRRRVPLRWGRPRTAAAAARLTDVVIADAQKGCLDWPARFLHPPVEDALVRLLLPTPVTPNMVTVFGGLVGVAAIVAFATGWLWTGLILVLLIGPLDGVDGKLARARIEYSRWGDLEHVLDKVLEYGWYLALGSWFAGQGAGLAGWLIALGISVFALAEAVQGEFFRRFTGRQLDDWGGFERRWRLVAGRRNTHFWTLLPFAAAGAWFAGFGVILAYAMVTWGVCLWRMLRALASYGTVHSAQIANNFVTTAYDFLPQRGDVSR